MSTETVSWQIEAFEYPAVRSSPAVPSVYGLTESSGEQLADCLVGSDNAGVRKMGADVADALAEESRRAFAAGREQGRVEGRQLERESSAAEMKTANDQRAKQLAAMMDQFIGERDRYLNTVEKEVVKLALAIAARILRREAQMDPLLLTGAVRVALGQLSGSTEVRVRVPIAELDLWRDALAHLPNLALRPQVIAGDGMRLGDCVVETALGSVDLGIRSQLGEIERGFFDNASRAAIAAPLEEPVETEVSAG